MKDQRGQALIETMAAAPIAGLVICIGAFLLYLTFAKAWLTRSAREAAVCLVTASPTQSCRGRLQMTMEKGLFIGNTAIDTFVSNSSGSFVKVSLSVRNLADKSTPLTISAEGKISKNL